MLQLRPHPTSRACPAPVGRSAEPDHLLLGLLVLAIAGVWIAVPLLALLVGRPALPGLGPLGSCLLLAIGIAQLLWALDLLLRRQTLTIDDGTVQLAERRLTGVHRWREPLAHYRGLRHRRDRVRHRYGWRVVHRLELVHAEPGKGICLISTRDERRLIAAADRWARMLGVPLWSATLAARGRETRTWSSAGASRAA
jgi:hypothetical protein